MPKFSPHIRYSPAELAQALSDTRGMTVADSHDIASRLEREVLDAVGEGTATAHMEPCGDAACPRCAPEGGSRS